ncbi:MAG: hypothetical protein E6K95_09775 [Thaumarchaeota archaeon]|nr:MAG: hypothetical protein E6K95_09775 [Nitrososphaerota archaeon]
MSDVNVDAQLKGNTLRVYVYALKKRKVGVREVQRALRLSNPSLAQYHLNKLRELGLLREEGGDYVAVYFAIITYQIYVYVPVVLWFTGFLALAAIIFWYEAQRAWRSAPSP